MTYIVPMGAVDVSDIGASPYRIAGDPVMALIAQINRFEGQKLSNSTVPIPKLPLTTVLDDRAATLAILIAIDRYDRTTLDVVSLVKKVWANSGLKDTLNFVTKNITELTVTIAQFGDSLDLAPANVGITQVDPKMKSKLPIGTIVTVGALALGAVVLARRMKR